jgi:hypothetical protein
MELMNQQEEIEQEARDLALNDCQMWDNLPPSAKEFYLQEAQEIVSDIWLGFAARSYNFHAPRQ